MFDNDTQRELLRDTATPDSALSITINMEMGRINQHQISAYNTQSVKTKPQQQEFLGANTSQNQSGRNKNTNKRSGKKNEQRQK